MSRIKFDTSARQRYAKVLGSELAEVFVALHEDLNLLFLECQQWQQLFSERQCVAILNEAASSMAWLIQEVLHDDILLGIARFVERDGNGRQRNLTLRSLPPLIPQESGRAVVQDKVDRAIEASAFATVNRHKRIGHADRAHRLGERKASRGSMAQVHKALSACAEAMQVAYRLFDPDLQLGFGGDLHPGAYELLMSLRRGNLARKAYLDRLQSGVLLPGDLEGEPPLPSNRGCVYPPGSQGD